MTAAARSRFTVRRSVQAGSQQSIDESVPVPFNCTLLQVLFVYVGAPDPGDTVHFGKESSIGVAFTIDKIREFEVGLSTAQQGICNEHFEYLNGDSIILFAANGNDIGVSIEVICEEGG